MDVRSSSASESMSVASGRLRRGQALTIIEGLRSFNEGAPIC